jgi:superoxide dismutase, Cu-Zn family
MIKNNIRRISVISGLLITAGVLVGCQGMEQGSGQKASAKLESRSGSKTTGEVNFVSQGKDVLVTGKFSGLKPNSEHGFHVHEKGDCSSADATSAGGHFNPDGKPHGSPGSGAHHAGDMPNIKTDAAGNATIRLSYMALRLTRAQMELSASRSLFTVTPMITNHSLPEIRVRVSPAA